MITVEPFNSPPARVSPEVACRVCASRSVLVDEVLEEGLLGLAQCTRCDYRWTWRPQRVFRVRRPSQRLRGVA